MRYSFSILLMTTGLLLGGCQEILDVKPETQVESSTFLTNSANLQTATYGNYSMLLANSLVARFHRFTEISSDNVQVLLAGNNETTTSIGIYTYQHTSNLLGLSVMWDGAYKLIYASNQVIQAIPDNAPPADLQLKGENLYLRALMHFSLVRIFGLPYAQNPAQNLGVPYLTKPDVNALPARNTVKECYDQLVTDLTQAASLMTVDKGNAYASRNAAYALLANVYLQRGEHEKVVETVNLVTRQNKYKLVTGTAFVNYFTTDHSTDQETIFCMRMTSAQNAATFGINYDYTDSRYAAASEPLMALLNEGKTDARLQHYIPLATTTQGTRYFVNKYTQNGNIRLSSPVFSRYAGLLLDRAEALAKLGRNAEALADVNAIRQRAGLTDLYSESNLRGRATVLDAVLDERRMELAFEYGYRRDDLLRNNRPLVRNYTTNLPGDRITIQPTNPNVVFLLPQTELSVNPNLVQNPQ